jgi:transcriptional regulator with XRE-family HTH domain
MAKRQREDLADFVRRTLKEKRLSTRDVEERAKRKGMRITHGYVSRIISHSATNLTVDKLKALAAGLGIREKEVFDRVSNEPLESEPDYHESDFAHLFSKYKNLKDEDKKELRTLIKTIDREIEWRLSGY